jgi:arylsulfatase A-like enzyme/Tfp pilus assembly protein PilF
MRYNIRMRFRIAACGLLLLPALLAAQQDILLITLDTTRADHLSCYGYARETTPAIDKFAQGAVRFTRAYTPVPITLPSHATILTGLWPKDHGVRDNMTDRLKPAVPVLAEMLKKNGYQTAAFVSSFVLDHEFGLDRGFGVYDDQMTFTVKETSEKNERPAGDTEKRVLGYLAGLPTGGKTFLWVHYYDPHHPYLSHPDTPAGMGDYDGEIFHMDRSVGRILDAWGKTRSGLVILVGDHGESLGEHGENYHGVFLYEPDVRVPLLIRGPGMTAGTDDRLASTADAAATILDFAKIPAPPLDGRSLLGDSVGHDHLFFESFLPANSFGWSPPFGILKGSEKYIHLPKPELYDIAADLGEMKNLVNSRRVQARGLSGQLKQEYGTEYSPPETAPDAETARKLDALGYRGGSVAHSDRDPKDLIWVVAGMDKGEALEEKGAFGEAEPIFLKILKENPENYPVLIKLASMYKKQNRRDESRTRLNQALSVSPRYAHAHYNLGAMDYEDGRFKEAAKEFETVLLVAPENTDAMFYLFRIALAQKAYDAARGWLVRAAKADPSSDNLYFNRGLLAADLNDMKTAADEFSRCLKIKPDYTDALVNLAQAHFKMGRADESIAEYRSALQQNPDQPQVYLTLGAILLNAREDVQGALECFQTFLKRYPTHAEAERVRDIVQGLTTPDAR